jgi:transcriptional regulator with XRE-family HTH domain
MGRTSHPVDESNKARAEIAYKLRGYLEDAGLTFEELAEHTPGVSRVTLQRAASGKCLAKVQTLRLFAEACGRSEEEIQELLLKRIEARIIERGVLPSLRAPNPRLISDERDMSRSLEYLYEAAGAPPLREIQERSEDPLSLPISTIGRIVNRKTLPADKRQLLSFVRGCGIRGRRELEAWSSAWDKVSTPQTTNTAPQAGPKVTMVLEDKNGKVRRRIEVPVDELLGPPGRLAHIVRALSLRTNLLPQHR